MATQNTFTGDNTTVDFPFTFPYLKSSDIKVSLDGTDQTLTTHYTLHNATTIRFVSAPETDKIVRIYRDTGSDNLSATFYPGSAIRSSDLNDNYTQNLYVTQEGDYEAQSAADFAKRLCIDGDGSNLNNVGGTTGIESHPDITKRPLKPQGVPYAISRANTAITTADGAVVTANNATTTANAADTKADTAVSTANTASTNATSAVNTANSAVTTANAAQAAVDDAVLYTPITNVAAIPGSPEDQDYIEVADTTGIEGFTPLASLPSGFTGDSGLTVKLKYTTSGSTWNYLSYHADDPEDRYIPVYGKHNTLPRIYTVKVVTKTSAHRYYLTGSSDGFTIGGIEAPFLTLVPGNTYQFHQVDSSNTGHTIAFYENADKSTPYTTDVTTNGTAGSPGAYTQIIVGDDTPANLHYQCTSHAYEGNGMATQTNVIGGGATGGGNDEVLYENGQTITTNYTITTNKSAYATGPVTINNSIVVTVPENSRWVIA